MTFEAIWQNVRRVEWSDRIGAFIIYGMTLLCVAGTVHIAVVLLVPRYAPADGWTRLAPVAGQESFNVLDRNVNGPIALPGLDPLFVNGACRLNLDEDPVRITLNDAKSFWTLALYDRRGTVVFSLSSDTTAEGRLNMLVVNAAQNARLKENPPEDMPSIVLVESKSNDLIALLRLFTPDVRDRAQSAGIITAAGCKPDPLQVFG